MNMITKLNQLKSKKGFTLIEMLVVIAIIAILVAIIIPTVTSATGKSKAATDAANLRSAKSVVTIGILDGTYKVDASGNVTKNGTAVSDWATELKVPGTSKYDGSSALTVTVTPAADAAGATIEVTYGSLTIDSLAAIAGSETTTAAGG